MASAMKGLGSSMLALKKESSSFSGEAMASRREARMSLSFL